MNTTLLIIIIGWAVSTLYTIFDIVRSFKGLLKKMKTDSMMKMVLGPDSAPGKMIRKSAKNPLFWICLFMAIVCISPLNTIDAIFKYTRKLFRKKKQEELAGPHNLSQEEIDSFKETEDTFDFGTVKPLKMAPGEPSEHTKKWLALEEKKYDDEAELFMVTECKYDLPSEHAKYIFDRVRLPVERVMAMIHNQILYLEDYYMPDQDQIVWYKYVLHFLEIGNFNLMDLPAREPIVGEKEDYPYLLEYEVGIIEGYFLKVDQDDTGVKKIFEFASIEGESPEGNPVFITLRRHQAYEKRENLIYQLVTDSALPDKSASQIINESISEEKPEKDNRYN